MVFPTHWHSGHGIDSVAVQNTSFLLKLPSDADGGIDNHWSLSLTVYAIVVVMTNSRGGGGGGGGGGGTWPRWTPPLPFLHLYEWFPSKLISTVSFRCITGTLLIS